VGAADRAGLEPRRHERPAGQPRASAGGGAGRHSRGRATTAGAHRAYRSPAGPCRSGGVSGRPQRAGGWRCPGHRPARERRGNRPRSPPGDAAGLPGSFRDDQRFLHHPGGGEDCVPCAPVSCAGRGRRSVRGAVGVPAGSGQPAPLHHGVPRPPARDGGVRPRRASHLGCDRRDALQPAAKDGADMTLKTTLIDAADLAALPPESVLIVDCRFALGDPAQGERDYCEGHVPGAVYASLDRDLSDLSRQAEGLGRHPLPPESAFSALLSRWGWRNGMQVVAYDTAGGALAAARLWWLLRLVGIPAAVLDGGYAAWLVADLPIETGMAAARAGSKLSLHYDESQLLLDHAAVAGCASGQLLDARAA